MSGLDLGPDGSLIPGDPGTSFLLGDTGLLSDDPVGLAKIGNPFAGVGITQIENFRRDALLSFARNAIRDSQGLEEINFINAKEDIFAGYFQGVIELGRLSVTLGARVAQYEGDFRAPQTASIGVDFSAAGADDVNIEAPGAANESNPVVIETSADNTEVLPRLQANYRVSDRWVLRFGYSTAIARPAFNALAGETDIDVDLTFGSGTLETAMLEDIDEVNIDITTGNPELENAKSFALDFIVEHYLNRETAITAGVFYKEIDNFIFVNENADFTAPGAEDIGLAQFIDNIPLTEEGEALLERLGGGAALAGFDNLDLDVSLPRNGRTAEVYGLELGVTHLFSWLPTPFDGLGFAGNVTFQETEADLELGLLDEDDALVALGLAKEGDLFVREVDFFNSPDITANANLFYEKDPIDLSLSWNYQAVALNQVDEFGIDQYDQSFNELALVFKYDLPIGEGERIGGGGDFDLFLRISDLTDGGAKFTSFQTFGQERQLSDFSSFNGREFRFGITGRF